VAVGPAKPAGCTVPSYIGLMLIVRIGLCSEARTMWLMSGIETAAFIAIVSLMLTMAVSVQ
jgi:hypothetical protein